MRVRKRPDVLRSRPIRRAQGAVPPDDGIVTSTTNTNTSSSAASVPVTVTVLGLGPMGRALASAFLASGHPTTVWNRTPGRADALVSAGATLARSATDAIAASELIVICVLNGDAARAILTPAADALRGRTLVNLSTDTPAHVRETAAWAASHGIDYVAGSIMTPITTIGESSAVLLYSGPEGNYRRYQHALASLGGTATYLGEDPGRAGSFDVALLDLFWTYMSGVMHAFALARTEQISAAELLPYLNGIVHIGPAIMEEYARHVDEEKYPGEASNLISAAAGMSHVIHAAEARGLDTSVLRAAHALAQRAIDAGHGEDALSRVTELLVGARTAAR